VRVDGIEHAIDPGFIVFNNGTCPYFEKFLGRIVVDKQGTEMSFSVHNDAAGFEFNGYTFTSLFAQRRNIFRPKFWRLLYDIVRFNKLCKTI